MDSKEEARLTLRGQLLFRVVGDETAEIFYLRYNRLIACSKGVNNSIYECRSNPPRGDSAGGFLSQPATSKSRCAEYEKPTALH